MSVIILAGGQSRRLGQDKTALTLGGRGLLDQTVQRLAALDRDIILSLAPGQAVPQIDCSCQIRIATDLHAGKGPLIGLYAGLKIARDNLSLAVACDMPFLDLALLRHLFDVAAGFDIVIPRVGKLVEPLHAIYAKTCLGPIQSMIERGDFQILQLLEIVKVRYIDRPELERFDPQHLSFFNINRPDDLQEAEAIVARQGGPP